MGFGAKWMACPRDGSGQPGKIKKRAAKRDAALVAEKKLTGRVEPQYPQMAKIAHIQGDVVLHILIDKQGHVANAKAKTGHPILIQAALDAVRKWDYQPFLLNGQPVDVESSVTVKFRP